MAAVEKAAADVSPAVQSQASAENANCDGVGRYELVSFATHLGTSTGCGHYVAHVRQTDGTWVYFNDAKVGLTVLVSPQCLQEERFWRRMKVMSVCGDQVSVSKEAPKESAYLYVFRRVDA